MTYLLEKMLDKVASRQCSIAPSLHSGRNPAAVECVVPTLVVRNLCRHCHTGPECYLGEGWAGSEQSEANFEGASRSGHSLQ